jgi:hypothetical protein
MKKYCVVTSAQDVPGKTTKSYKRIQKSPRTYNN